MTALILVPFMWIGVLLGLLASASWAVANVFVQRASRATGPYRALVWSQVIGGPALAVFAFALDRPTGVVTAATFGWGAAAAVAAVLAYVCLFRGLERGRLSVVVPIMSSWSVISAAISIFVLRHPIRTNQIIGAALAVIGVVVISRFSQREPEPSEGEGPSPSPSSAKDRGAATGSGLFAALGAAVGFGVLIPAIDRLTPVAGQLGSVPLVFLLELILGVPLALAARISLRPPPRRAWPAVAMAGVAETAGFVFIAIGIARAPIAVVSPFAGLSSAFTVMYAWAVLGERPSFAVLTGAVLVCSGVVALAL